MTWQEIITTANTNFRNTYTNDNKILWLKNLLYQIWNLKYNKDTTQALIEITTNIQWYDLPDNCELDGILELQLETGANSGSYNTVDYQEIGGSELSSFYTINLGKIFISEKPTEDKTAWLYYLPLPVAPTSTTLVNTPEIPSAFHELFVYGLCERMAAARGDAIRKNNFKADFDTLLTDYLMQQLNSSPEYPTPKDELPRRAGSGRNVATAISESEQ